MSLCYGHVDVFSAAPFSGNSLAVFADSRGLSGAQMLRITRELRHFESIFLEPTQRPNAFQARVFDLFEELPFAGHPILGAAAYLHHRSASEVQSGGSATQLPTAMRWAFELGARTVSVTTQRTTQHGIATYFGLLDQGRPEFIGHVGGRANGEDAALLKTIAESFGLTLAQLHPALPLEVVSTGLRYLIVPVTPGTLAQARVVADLSQLLRCVNAQFAVLLDEAALEIRHWNNDGVLEDVATGSAAGTIGAYRLRHGLARSGEVFTLRQGRFTGRPSTLQVMPEGPAQSVVNVQVGGDVVVIGGGTLDLLP